MEDKHFLLPAKYKFSHNFSYFLHDQILEILISGEEAKIYDILVEFKEDHHSNEFDNLKHDEVLGWFQKNGYELEVRSLYFKQICAALISDFLHFIYESLQCSAKGKLTVAFALLRKPLKENLFYLEWLLARPGDFLTRFEASHPNRFNLPYKSEEGGSEHLKIIREAIQATEMQEWLDAEFIHELRYKKNSYFSLEASLQQANHLVTTFKYIETESTNLNFVFSNDEDRQSQWEGYYMCVPLLLYHAVEIVEALFKRFAKRENADLDITPLRNLAGMILYFQHAPWKGDKNKTNELFLNHFRGAELGCPSCESLYPIDENNILLFYKRSSLKCSSCGDTLNIAEALVESSKRDS